MQFGTTRQAIQILIDNGLRVMILTKGGMRAARDFDLLETYDRCRFGTTVVFRNQADASQWELNAPPVADRIQAIHQAHGRGIKTWVSLEPVIDPDQALELIQELHPKEKALLQEIEKLDAIKPFLLKGTLLVNP